MEVTGRDQFACPVVKAIDAGIAGHCCVETGALGVAQASSCRLNNRHVTRPDAGPQLQPALPVGAPKDLLHKLRGGIERVPLQHSLNNVALGYQPVAHPRRQARHVRAISGPAVEITFCGVVPPGSGNKFLEPRKCGLPRWVQFHGPHPSHGMTGSALCLALTQEDERRAEGEHRERDAAGDSHGLRADTRVG